MIVIRITLVYKVVTLTKEKVIVSRTNFDKKPIGPRHLSISGNKRQQSFVDSYVFSQNGDVKIEN